MAIRSGGQILVDCLKKQGVEKAFGVPGESYLAVLDALYESGVDFTVCRQEGGAAMMAEAYGKLTGKPGVCMVTRGPGATNASAGVHIAMQDSTPMILLIGQVGRDMMDREAFQEIDYRRMYGQLAKWVAQIDSAERIPEYINRAFSTALSGRPGPVVLALPEDMLTDVADVMDVGPAKVAAAHPDATTMAEFRSFLAKAERPFVIAGGGGWSVEASLDLAEFAERNGLPVGLSFRAQDYLDNEHECYAGHVGIGINPKLGQRIRESDLLIVIGARLGEMTTGGYTLIDAPRPSQTLVHVYPDGNELNRVYAADLPIVASSPAFLKAACALDPVKSSAWKGRAEAAHRDYLDHATPVYGPGDIQMADVVTGIRDMVPEDAVICNGAGNYAIWVHRFHRYRTYRSQLAPTSGSMGYGVPSAIAAKLAAPERTVISFSGDGCYMMHGQELATAVQYGAKVIFIVVNNGMYGTIRMHQERRYPGRVSGTALNNPDFAALAKAYGASGEAVTTTDGFREAFTRALKHDGPALIEIRVDPEALTPAMSLSAIRAEAERKGS